MMLEPDRRPAWREEGPGDDPSLPLRPGTAATNRKEGLGVGLGWAGGAIQSVFTYTASH